MNFVSELKPHATGLCCFRCEFDIGGWDDLYEDEGSPYCSECNERRRDMPLGICAHCKENLVLCEECMLERLCNNCGKLVCRDCDQECQECGIGFCKECVADHEHI